jgi:hypothetical protein
MEPTRREVVQMLVALGVAPTALAQPSIGAIGAGDVKGALAIQGRPLADDDVEVVRRALQWSLDRFQPVRDLEIDDAVVPAVTFVPRSR